MALNSQSERFITALGGCATLRFVNDIGLNDERRNEDVMWPGPVVMRGDCSSRHQEIVSLNSGKGY